ncbi:acetyltransferase [Colletotrichum orchidophilum]|uniref:Acetyltransferase n=1 Tax=Colletotrichum orchidophilum TaxID=1209926 RepID=A0A1G4BNL8_9PEZI|nr:acetyltransferase [Colletotrichum orchidophilum]OHF03039.1 acetyltransferase [Colletotrichum orchidophilum]
MASTQDLPAPILALTKATVRPYHPTDAAALAQAANSDAVARYLRYTFPRPYTLADAESWIALNSGAGGSPVHNWVIACPASGRPMGSIGLVPGKDVYARGYELGYWLGEEFWGKGVMGEVVPAFVRWVFEGMGRGEEEESDREGGRVERVWAGMFAVNKGSQRVLEKSGFVLEGRLRRAVVKEGIVMDELLYSFIREDLNK